MHRVTPLRSIYIPRSADAHHAAVNDARAEIQAEAANDSAAAKTACGGRQSRHGALSITVRPSPEEKARFRLLAQQLGISESALALRAIRALLDREGQRLDDQSRTELECVAARDRITIRLRPGDGLAVIRRATERGMRPATYLSALVRAHISADPPLPSAEINALKMCVGALSKLETELANTSRHGIPSGPAGELYREAIRRTRREIAVLGGHFAGFARTALIAWETRS